MCEKCSNVDKSIDHKREYSILLTFLSMMDLVHRDAIREGDGEALLSIWRANMTRFSNGRHWHYLTIGLHFLVGEY